MTIANTETDKVVGKDRSRHRGLRPPTLRPDGKRIFMNVDNLMGFVK